MVITISLLLTYLSLLVITISLPQGSFLPLKKHLVRDANDKFQWNLRLFIVLLSIMIIAGLRGSYIGTDFHNYLEYYNYILEHGKIGAFFKKTEIGWEMLNYLFGKNAIPSEIFFGLVAGIIWFFFIQGSYKFQFLLPLMFFGILTNGFFFWTMSGLRQSIAIGIFFYAIKYIIEKKPWHYALSIVIASLFHTSALIMLPVYLLGKLQFNKKVVLYLFLFSLFLVGNYQSIHEVFSDYISMLVTKLGFSAYTGYLESQKLTANLSRMGSGLGVVLRIAMFLYILYMSEKVIKRYPELKIYFILFFIMAIVNNIFFSVELIGRVMNYFAFCYAITFAGTIYLSSSKKEKIISSIFIIAYLILFIKKIYLLGLMGDTI